MPVLEEDGAELAGDELEEEEVPLALEDDEPSSELPLEPVLVPLEPVRLVPPEFTQ